MAWPRARVVIDVTEMAPGGESEKLRANPATTLKGHLPCGCNEDDEEISLVWTAGGNNLGIGIFPQLPTSIGDWKLKDEKYRYVNTAGDRKREPSNELRPTS